MQNTYYLLPEATFTNLEGNLHVTGWTVPTRTRLELVLTLPMASRKQSTEPASLLVPRSVRGKEGPDTLGTTEKMPGRSFRSRRLEEPTSETMRETGGEQEGAVAGDVRSSWKEGSSEDPTPS
ncbi:hypothetical protein NDU88_004354 [Pleurodeles waltl]|uniref:Uncharacterized protein n=1 Tax=Pleurodeles waltl TaxID=8319 RepID=A0AAV7VJL3_PLEWA|nr:hypothetical protein NDU88_004354 [Pleurodeles waltl]